MTLTQSFSIDIERGLFERKSEFTLITGDKNSHEVIQFFQKDDERFVPEKFVCYFVRPDKKALLLDTKSEGNRCSVTLSDHCYSISGIGFLVTRCFHEPNGLLTVSKIEFRIEKGLYTEIEDPEHTIPSVEELQALISQLDDLTSEVQTKLDQGEFNGTTPHIGENGNWWIGETDTGVVADSSLEDDVEAIGSEINFLHPLSITKFTVSPSMAEKGSTVTEETFTYDVNRLNASLTLEGESVTGQTSSRTDNLTSDKTYTLSASLDDASVNDTATISFVAPIYYGVSSSYTLSDETVLALTRVLTKTRSRAINVDAADGQYILYALPVSLGTPVFKVGGFEGGFTLAGTFDFTNASGHAESYNLYRSVNAGLGSTTVTVS